MKTQQHMNIILSSVSMHMAQQKRALPNLLKKISLKLNYLFLHKLILLEQQKTDYKDVRHYDLQCEGIQMLVSFFRNKQQYHLLKGFTCIKEGQHVSQEKGAQPNAKAYGTTRRTYLNTTFTASQSSPIKEIFRPTVRSQRSEKTSSLHDKQELNRTSNNLQVLLNRVKLANSRNEGTYSFREQQKSMSYHEISKHQRENYRQNYSNYTRNRNNNSKTVDQQQRFRTNHSNIDQKDVNYYNYYKSQLISARNNRRQFIMDKFNQIQNQLHELNGRKQLKKPEISKQILSQINSIKQKFKLQL